MTQKRQRKIVIKPFRNCGVRIMAEAKAKKIRVKLVRSPIGRKPEQRRTVKALGLRKMNSIVEKEATPQILGMVNSVSHLVSVEEL